MCGVFGVVLPGGEPNEAASIAALGLFALQHRGQESAGLAVSDGEQLMLYKDLGMISSVLDERRLPSLRGQLAIAHCRYSTTGSTIWENAQPTYRLGPRRALAIGHNGNLVNTRELLDQLQGGRARLPASTDTELLTALLADEPAADTVDALVRVLPRVRGAYSLVILDERRVIGVRDPFGFRPLVLGRLPRASGHGVDDGLWRGDDADAGCAAHRLPLRRLGSPRRPSLDPWPGPPPHRSRRLSPRHRASPPSSGNNRADLSWTNPTFASTRVDVVRKAGSAPPSPPTARTSTPARGTSADRHRACERHRPTTTRVFVAARRRALGRGAARARRRSTRRPSSPTRRRRPARYSGTAAGYTLGAVFHVTARQAAARARPRLQGRLDRRRTRSASGTARRSALLALGDRHPGRAGRDARDAARCSPPASSYVLGIKETTRQPVERARAR